jgi:hypothetical protein
VSQISPPVRILLIGAVVFLAAWFTLLRPKAAEVPPLTTSTTTTTPVATSTPQTGLGKAVAAAKSAAGKAVATATPATGAATTTTTQPEPKAQAPATAAIPAAALAKLPKDVAGALETRHVVVLAVLADDAKPWRPLADDERYVRNALRKVNRYDGKVFVKQVPAAQLSTYSSLVNDLHVTQTPSVVVIDRNLKGKVLTGYVDRIAINQAIVDARRDSIEPDVGDDYLRQSNALCGHYENRATRWSLPTVRGQKPLTAAYQRAVVGIRKYRREIARTPAPAKYRALKKQWLKVMATTELRAVALTKASKTSKFADDTKADAIWSERDFAKLDRMFDKAGLTDCASNRRS